MCYACIRRDGLRIQRTERWTASAAVLIAVMMGLLLIYTAVQVSVVGEDTVLLPGVPLQGTKFSGVLSDTPDPSALVRSVWAVKSQDPYRLRVALNESLIERGLAYSAAESFIDEDFLPYLEYDENFTHFYPEIYSYEHPVIWQFCFANYTRTNSTHSVLNLMVFVCVNAFTGGVVSYGEYWNPDWPVPEALRDKAASDQPSIAITASEAEDRVVDYLAEHNYTLLSSTRHVRTWLTTRNEAEGMGEGLVYVVSLRTPFGKVFADRWFDGVTIDVDSCTGRVSAFTYILLELPLIDIDELDLINPEEAYRLEYNSMQGKSWNSPVRTGNICLRLVHGGLSDGHEYALSWSIEFRSLSRDGFVYWERATHDASSRRYLYPGLYADRATSTSGFMIPFQAVVMAALVAIAANLPVSKWLTRIH